MPLPPVVLAVVGSFVWSVMRPVVWTIVWTIVWTVVGSIVWAVVWAMPGRFIVTMFVWSPVVAWVPHRAAGVIAADVQTATVEQVTQAEAEADRVRIVVAIGSNVVALWRLVDIHCSACHCCHSDRWPVACNIPGTVGLAASGTITLPLLVVNGDGGDELSAGLSLVTYKGSYWHHDTTAASIGVQPVRSLVGFIVFQGELQGVAHRLLFHFDQGR